MTDIFKPQFKFLLQAKITEHGHKHTAEFCEKINVHPSTMSKILNGRENPNLSIAQKIADGLGLSLEELKELLR